MAKAGQTQGTTTKQKDFAGTGVEGQKGQGAEKVTGTPPTVEPTKAQKSVPADQDPKVITGEHVLKNLRDKGHQV